MSYALVFYLGVMLGTFVGVGIMCLLAISREAPQEKEFLPPAERCSASGPPAPAP